MPINPFIIIQKLKTISSTCPLAGFVQKQSYRRSRILKSIVLDATKIWKKKKISCGGWLENKTPPRENRGKQRLRENAAKRCQWLLYRPWVFLLESKSPPYFVKRQTKDLPDLKTNVDPSVAVVFERFGNKNWPVFFPSTSQGYICKYFKQKYH